MKHEGAIRKNGSLRWGMTLLLISCWIIPYIIVVTVSSVISNRNNRTYITETITATVDSAMTVLRTDLDSVVADSVRSSYVPTFRNAYLQFQKDGQMYTLHNVVSNFLSENYSRSGDIRAAFFVLEDSRSNEWIYAVNPQLSQMSDVRSFYNNGAAQIAREHIPTLDSEVKFVFMADRLYMMRVLSLRQNMYEPYAALVLEINTDQIFQGVRQIPWVSDVALCVGDAEIHVLGEGSLAMQQETAGLLGDEYIVRGNLPGARYTVQYAMRLSPTPLFAEARRSLFVILLLSALAIPLLALFFSYFYRKVTTPIRSLSELAHEIEEGGFGNRIDAAALGSQEFEALGGCLNAMSERLDEQFERIYREELALRDARIKALQSHINPHFLGNTLEIINWEARLSGNVKLSRMLEALTTVLEAVTDRRDRQLVRLSEEMVYVNAYLYIIGERLGKRLKVVQQLDKELMDWMVPRLILQPLVENAVEHGVSSRHRGVITIRARRSQADWMTLEVENDAPLSPQDEERIAQLLSPDAGAQEVETGNIGIRNVNQRLKILYGESSGLSVQNTEKGSTISSLCIHHTGERQIESTENKTGHGKEGEDFLQ